MELGWLAPDGSFYATEWSAHYDHPSYNFFCKEKQKEIPFWQIRAKCWREKLNFG